MEKKMSKFKTICKVSRAFGSTYSHDQLLDLIVQSAIDTMGGKAACLFLFDLEEDISIPVAQSGLSDNYLHAGRKGAKEASGHVMEKGYVSIPNVMAEQDVDNLESKKAEGIAAILSVPMRVRDEVIGVLTLYMAEPTDFSDEEIEFLTALAEQGGMAIEHTRLVDRIKTYTNLFHELAMNINSSMDIKEVMNILTEKVTKAMLLKAASIRLLDEGKEKLKLIASYGLSERYLEKGPLSADANLTKALKGEITVVKDVTIDKRIRYQKELIEEGLISLIIVPIRTKDSIIGVMVLFSGVYRDFSEEEVKLVEALAQQGGLAIQNMSLYMMLQQDMKDLEEDMWSHRSWF